MGKILGRGKRKKENVTEKKGKKGKGKVKGKISAGGGGGGGVNKGKKGARDRGVIKAYPGLRGSGMVFDPCGE
jgi:hypothetical protein